MIPVRMMAFAKIVCRPPLNRNVFDVFRIDEWNSDGDGLDSLAKNIENINIDNFKTSQ